MRKLLLVAVSVGVFLLVTITVAIILMTPRTNVTDFSSSVPYSHGRTHQLPDIMGNVQPEPAIISNLQETTVNITNEIPGNIAEVDISNGDSLIIQIPRPVTAAVPDAPSQPSAPVARSQPPAPIVTETRQPPAPRPAPAARPAAPARPAQTRTINDFWVQTGAFSSMIRAEDAKELLASKGLTSIIETRIVNGQNFYRVRLGPYTSENEAKHWLDIVKLIDGFQNSQVRQSTRQL